MNHSYNEVYQVGQMRVSLYFQDNLLESVKFKSDNSPDKYILIEEDDRETWLELTSLWVARGIHPQVINYK